MANDMPIGQYWLHIVTIKESCFLDEFFSPIDKMSERYISSQCNVNAFDAVCLHVLSRQVCIKSNIFLMNNV